jgi:hypothetical protein
MAKRRGAVVIGVNKTGGLTELDSAAAAADEFAKWLKSEGFEVKVITDATGPVAPQQIADAINTFVAPGNCHQLVIYFSGHGYWKNDAELWLLTNAPADANAAVSWAETAEFAKDCGIPNVVLISDACRSIPNTPQKMKVRGSIVFPNADVPRSRAKVDKFMAAAMGRSAYEVPLGAAGQRESVFTHCFLRGFKAPDHDMVQQVKENGETIQVVPNRRLGKYLQREVAALLASVNVQLDQTPDAEVLSDDDVYIGRAQIDAALDSAKSGESDASAKLGPPIVDLRDVAAVAVGRALDQQPSASASEMRAIDQLARSSGFEDAANQAKAFAELAHFETETGFGVIGASIAEVLAAEGGRATVLATGDGRNPGIIRIEPELPGCSVALRFSNGRGMALPALRGYIGHVLVDGNNVLNVSYVPSDNSWRWSDYVQRRERIENLRAAAAAAVRMGVFRLDDKQRAATLADHIRVGKGLDPALGLFAAYAYSEADQREDVESVLSYMRQDLDADLFDIAMLARARTQQETHAPPIVPFCPMLTQGWNLLRVRGVALPKVLDDAQDELEPALWTTFRPARIQSILNAMKQGELR